MVRNRIKVLRAEADITATTLAERLEDCADKVTMSCIERGKVLPTKADLKAMCEIFGCKPSDIYAMEDIDLRALEAEPEQSTQTLVCVSSDDLHGVKRLINLSGKESGKDKQQLRVWMGADEKAALVKAINGLGYESIAEWLRDMYRQTVHKYISLGLGDAKKLHEALPPVTENRIAGNK